MKLQEAPTSGAATSALAKLSADEREKHVLSAIRQAASAMHLDIQDDTPLMEAVRDTVTPGWVEPTWKRHES